MYIRSSGLCTYSCVQHEHTVASVLQQGMLSTQLTVWRIGHMPVQLLFNYGCLEDVTNQYLWPYPCTVYDFFPDMVDIRYLDMYFLQWCLYTNLCKWNFPIFLRGLYMAKRNFRLFSSAKRNLQIHDAEKTLCWNGKSVPLGIICVYIHQVTPCIHCSLFEIKIMHSVGRALKDTLC